MLSNSILFAILTVLASPALAGGPGWRQPCYVNGRYGALDGALCLVADATVDVERREVLGGGLLGVSGKNDRTQNGAPGFGWFHPGAYQQGDRCWQRDREGVVNGALCVLAEVQIGNGETGAFSGRFDQPYYGYGHNFGWYHPGPYVEGDRCFQEGWEGYVRDALCIQVDATTRKASKGGLLNGLGFGKRSLLGPDYWEEPRFNPQYNFGWFHDGQFADGDRCWSQGWYGNVKDSLCVITKLGLNLKRGGGGLDGLAGGLTGGLLTDGQSSYRNGERCFKRGGWGRWWRGDCNVILGVDAVAELGDSFSPSPFQEGDKCWRAGNWGYWQGTGCNILADVGVEIKRALLSPSSINWDDPRFGDRTPCRYGGREGVLRDTVCVIADVDLGITKRDMEDGDTDEVPIDDEEFDVIDEANELEERAPLLSFVPGENRGHALGKAVGDMTDGIKTRNLMSGLGQGGGLKQLDVLKLDQLQKLGGAQGVDSKSNGLLGVLTGGNLLGKRDIVSDIGALQLTDTLGLNRRSGDLPFMRRLGGLGDIIGTSTSGNKDAAGKLFGLGGITPPPLFDF